VLKNKQIAKDLLKNKIALVLIYLFCNKDYNQIAINTNKCIQK